MCYEERQKIWGGHGSEEQVDMGGLHASQGHGDVRARIATKGHVLALGLNMTVSMVPVTMRVLCTPGVWVTTYDHVSE